MKNIALFIAVLLISMSSICKASPYFRLIDISHPQIGAGFLISPKDPLSTEAVTDLALITHSSADGSIIPEAWQSVLPPESWVPFQVGFGGSLRGDALIAPGMSANVAPVIAALALRGVSGSSNSFLVALKGALDGSTAGQIRLGGALRGTLVHNGVFQSLPEMFPGVGILQILGNSARIDAGFAWKF